MISGMQSKGEGLVREEAINLVRSLTHVKCFALYPKSH